MCGPDIAGRDVANPASMLLSAMMFLDDIGWSEAARSLERAQQRTNG
jgi:isocitrate dehydrogenase